MHYRLKLYYTRITRQGTNWENSKLKQKRGVISLLHRSVDKGPQYHDPRS